MVIKNLEVLFNLLYCVIILKQYLDRQLGLHRLRFWVFSDMIQGQGSSAYWQEGLKWKDTEPKLIGEDSEDRKELMEEQEMSVG